MWIRTTKTDTNTTYFVTFTCYKWLQLFEITQLYDNIYLWFNKLTEKGNYILGYVIMPNHLHFLIRFNQTEQTINDAISEGKRFRAYEIIKRLKHIQGISFWKS